MQKEKSSIILQLSQWQAENYWKIKAVNSSTKEILLIFSHIGAATVPGQTASSSKKEQIVPKVF